MLRGVKVVCFHLCKVDKVLWLPCSLRAFCVDKLSPEGRDGCQLYEDTTRIEVQVGFSPVARGSTFKLDDSALHN